MLFINCTSSSCITNLMTPYPQLRASAKSALHASPNRSGDIYQYFKYLKVLKNLATAGSRHTERSERPLARCNSLRRYGVN